MKISLNWLNDYIDVSEFFEDTDKLSELLTQAGLEVEGIENLAQQYKNVVVGRVAELGKHPDADRLTLCQVEIGDSTTQIVCGATNHRQGDYIVAALPGAVLPGDFKIKKSKIRGVESFGMMCSEVELGLADESPGIMILEKGAPVGQSFAEYYGLNDVIFELSVTPNRADCLSHVGLARELSCLLDRPLKMPDADVAVASGLTSEQMKLSVKDSERCPRYTGRFIRGVKIQESPSWLKRRLESIGLNSINNVVDITNFVMMEMGQPLHAFDADQVRGREISVDTAKDGETFITLDGTEIKLSGDELVIRDGERPVALAGVVGGVNSGVSDDTKDLFIESAYFTMSTVRKTARKFGIETDSAYRFSRGVDPEGVFFAMNRACKLVLDIAGGEAFDQPYDNYPNRVDREPIKVSVSFIGQKLGYEVNADDFASWMRRLGCEVLSNEGDTYQVKPPAYRWDLNCPEDFVEEFARLNGYDRIPETLPKLADEPTSHVAEYTLTKAVQARLKGQGFQQALNYSFLDGEFQKEFLGDMSKLEAIGLKTDGQSVSLMNPLSEELGEMRMSVLPWLCKNVAFNDRHGHTSGKLFETGFVFGKDESEYNQNYRLGLAIWGESVSHWQKENVPLVFQLKTEVESFLSSLNSSSWKWRSVESEKVPGFLHPGQFASLTFEGKTIGFVGTLHPQWREKLKIRQDVALAEFDLQMLLRGQPRKVKAKTPSKFPKVERDLAFVMPKSLAVGDVMDLIRKTAGKRLVQLSVFDVYEGENVGADERSVAFRLNYQGTEETMTDDQILALQNEVINSLSHKFSISVR